VGSGDPSRGLLSTDSIDSVTGRGPRAHRHTVIVIAGLPHPGDEQGRAEGDLLDGSGDERPKRADRVRGGVLVIAAAGVRSASVITVMTRAAWS
jgi:hypothetical protein